jgi:hypothetical protein
MMNTPPSDGVERQFIRAEWNWALAVLNAGESFFYGSRNDHTVLD